MLLKKVLVVFDAVGSRGNGVPPFHHAEAACGAECCALRRFPRPEGLVTPTSARRAATPPIFAMCMALGAPLGTYAETICRHRWPRGSHGRPPSPWMGVGRVPGHSALIPLLHGALYSPRCMIFPDFAPRGLGSWRCVGYCTCSSTARGLRGVYPKFRLADTKQS